LLAQAVAAVQQQTRPPREVILVIDGNEELQARAARELDGALVVANRHGRGLSGARRTGSETATSPILAFLDDDAIPEPQWLAEIVAGDQESNVLGVGGEIVPMWLSAAPGWLPPELYWVVGCTYAGMPVAGGRLRNPIGANMSMRADVLARAGSFDSSLGRVDQGTPVAGTAEETELSIRATRLHPGGYWAYRPQARVRHAVPPERTTVGYFVRRCRVEGTAKAILAGLTGADAGLSSERIYVRAVLPRAFVRELRSAVHGHSAGVARAGAIVGGLAITATSYLIQRGRARL
jgi:glycosyltransferase involved in cell wall biosynthesis